MIDKGNSDCMKTNELILWHHTFHGLKASMVSY